MRCVLALAALLNATAPAIADCCTEASRVSRVTSDEEGDLHLLIRHSDGNYQLWRGLTEHECEFMKARALGQPATEDEKAEAARKVEAQRHEQELRDAEARGLCAGAKDGETKTLSDGRHTAGCRDGKPAYLYSSGGTIGYATSGIVGYTMSAECFR